jgi:aspartate aminotransferase
MPQLAAHLQNIPVAATMAAAARARALRAEGRDIISLSLGEPGFPTPPHVVQAAHEAALNGETKYPPLDGTPALIASVRRKFLRDNGLDYPDAQILVGHGAKQIIYDALTATLDPGFEVIIPAPYWNAYPIVTALAGAVPVFVPCDPAGGFLPDPARIEAAITPRTRWLILNFPNNPSGAVCPASHLLALADRLRRHPHVWIMADDIYEYLIHDGTRHATMAELAPDLADRVLTISGVSKSYAMTGWRIGFAGGPARLIRAMSLVQGQATGGVSPVAQAAAVAALDGPQQSVADMRTIYAARARRISAHLDALPHLRCACPKGAFYVFVDIAGCIGRRSPAGRPIGSDADFCTALVDEAGVAAVHGAAFGLSPFVRLSIAAEDSLLDAACDRIGQFCSALLT